MLLSRDSILSADDLARERVDCPEWGGHVCVRTMTASERDRFEAAHLKGPESDIRARMALATVCDDAGAPLFSADDLAALGAKASAPLSRIFEAALRLNVIAAPDVDDAEKN